MEQYYYMERIIPNISNYNNRTIVEQKLDFYKFH